MTRVLHQLQHLALAYFHQDYDLEAASPSGVIQNFAEAESRGALTELKSDIRDLLASGMPEEKIRELWVEEYGASYDPASEGITYVRWFSQILSQLPD